MCDSCEIDDSIFKRENSKVAKKVEQKNKEIIFFLTVYYDRNSNIDSI